MLHWIFFTVAIVVMLYSLVRKQSGNGTRDGGVDGGTAWSAPDSADAGSDGGADGGGGD